jgi:hypothetical protein
MDDVFDRMFDIINEPDPHERDREIEAEIRDLKAQEVNIRPTAPRPNNLDFDPENNILDPKVRDNFAGDIFEEMSLFTAPQSTTITMEGYLSNIRFHEAELIGDLEANEDVVIMRCNFGKVIYPGYTEPVIVKTSNRGRKKKEKRKKNRKKQGAGTDFNSQITFMVRSETNPPPEMVNGIYHIPSNSALYKFKVFRTGEVQLPGVKPELIGDVINCADKIVRVLNFRLHPNGAEDELIKMVNFNPVMKNYKFRTKIEDGQILDLVLLKKILSTEKSLQYGGEEVIDYNREDPPDCPSIFDIKHTREETKLSVKFRTPIFGKPDKTTRVNVFMRGKVNILGAFDVRDTRKIYTYLHWIIASNTESLIVTEASHRHKKWKWSQNIDNIDDSEANAIVAKFIMGLPILPTFTAEEYTDMERFIDECYAEANADDIIVDEICE